MLSVAGIELHNGKTRIWNRAGVEPPNIQDLGGEEGAWAPAGVKILGVPVGSEAFNRRARGQTLAGPARLPE